MSIKFMWLTVPLALAVVSWGDSPGHPDLAGNWQLAPSQCEIHSHMPSQLTWHIEQDDSSIHLIQRTQERKNPDDIRCATDGKDCRIKDEGHAATVSFYYNGAVLVELESEGQNRDTVTKKRMQVSPDGSTLTVEVIHVMPAGRLPEKLVLTRQVGEANR
jgi:hypothetical protein